MKVGTRSVLFGVHCFWIHPWFVALAWWRLYGFPWDVRLWAAFFLHDVGYWGKPNMDGPEGELHPEVGALLMGALFGQEWHDFTLLHSRYFAKRVGRPFSRLCVADKYSVCVTPWWLYRLLANASGEIEEYLENAVRRCRDNGWVSADERRALTSMHQEAWYRGLQAYMSRWVEEHKDGREDHWTNSGAEQRAAK